MTALADLSSITFTTTAKAAAAAKGVDLASIATLAKSHAIELAALLKTIVSVHPSTGGDASNYAALNAVIAELA